ncbi:MAG: beta-N-acetylhexosaminidase [Terriglobia bacterium]
MRKPALWMMLPFTLLFLRPARAAGAPNDLMPVPASVEFNAGRLRLDGSFRVSVTGYSDARLQRAVDRAVARLERRTGFTLSHEVLKGSIAATLIVTANGPGEAIQGVEEDETYELQVTPQQASLRAPTVVGVLRGLETLLQLVETDGSGYYFAAASIHDQPRFPWRGLLLDPARHFLPVAVIERNLDAMAMVKLNVLHWHLSDDEGFRIESHRYPRLQELGSDGQYYTQQQVREVVAYARDRGVRVVPEFDIPGHATSWFVGYPQYASAPGPYQIARSTFDVKLPAFDPTREEVYAFIDGFIGEISALFPDVYWHIGGDEVKPDQWDANPAIQAFKKKHGFRDDAALQAYFNQRLMNILKKYRKQMVGWDEVLNPALPKETVIDSWRDTASLAQAVRQGFRGMLSAPYYLDAMETAATYYAADPISESEHLDAAAASRIMGGEACAWAEYLDQDNIESRLWPRTAAIAERFWSPREVRDTDDMYRRLDRVNVQLEEAGVRHLTNPNLMLRRLAGAEDIRLLRAFLRLVEPQDAISRFDEPDHPNRLTPLVTLPDIALPDASGRREVGALVDALLRDAPRYTASRAELEREFAAWRELPAALDALSAHAPLVRGAAPAAAKIAALGAAGQEALGYLTRGETPAPAWMQGQLALLDEAAKPQAHLRVAVAPAVRKLILAAAHSGEAPRN